MDATNPIAPSRTRAGRVRPGRRVADRLLRLHVEQAELLELARPAERADVDRAGAAALDELGDLALRPVVVGGHEDVELLAARLAGGERPREGGVDLVLLASSVRSTKAAARGIARGNAGRRRARPVVRLP